MPPGTKSHVRIYSQQWRERTPLERGQRYQHDAIGKQRLFQMFHRMHTNLYPETGIGLDIVRNAVEHMGGETGVESAPGKGSRF